MRSEREREVANIVEYGFSALCSMKYAKQIFRFRNDGYPVDNIH